MNETKWTPGPWKITSCVDYWIEHENPLTEQDDDFRGIAHCGDISWPNCSNRQKQWLANAHLIAAAPELYEALKRCDETIENMAKIAAMIGLEGTNDWDTLAGGVDLYGVQDAVKAALAKARGEAA